MILFFNVYSSHILIMTLLQFNENKKSLNVAVGGVLNT